jgi:Methyltransferase domain
VNKTEATGEITGKINANPNPLFFGQRCVISWETNDPAGAEIRVSTGVDDEQLVTQAGPCGHVEIPWINDSKIYDFRLYAASQADKPIDTVRVKRDFESVPLILRELADEALRGNIGMAELSRFVAALIPAFLQTGRFCQVFPVLLQQLAVDVMNGNVGAIEVSEFIATVIPKYLDKSIAGKIVAAPNPISFGESFVRIAWGTNDPAGGEVRVSTSPGDEMLLTREPSGQMEISWIADSTIYEFRLYAASQPDTPVDSVKVRRDLDSAPMILRELADEVLRGNVDMVELSRFVATVMPRCLHGGKFQDIFPLWERHGFHVTPVHFYQPIPDTQSLPETLWTGPSKLVGFNMNASVQLDLLRNHFPKFRDEYEQFPTTPAEEPGHFYLNNHLFDGIDALVAYCMTRHFQPELIIEVGGGFSSLLLGQAATKNNNSDLICIEPFPQEFLKHGFAGLHSLIEKKVQDMDIDFFSQLGSGDVLFIDSSHTVKIGGDVNYLFLEVLPRLKPGVIVHVHDIFFPFDYRRDWVKEEFRFWTEQYLLQAFLAFNSEFEVLMANRYLAHKYSEDLKAAFPNLGKLKANSKHSISWGGGSFWMRRKTQPVNDLTKAKWSR